MRCTCGSDMTLVIADDNPGGNWAFNVYHCGDCGMICKEDVWDHAGLLWIDTNGQTTRIEPNKEPHE
ncbi:MAG: hypothetical protein V3W41_14625 [Planctomycetota bacterium]